MKSVFRDTVSQLWPRLKAVRSKQQLELYRDHVDEWKLIVGVMRKLGLHPNSSPWLEWKKVIDRKPEWKRVYEYVLTGLHPGGYIEPTEERCKSELEAVGLGSCVPDVAAVDPLPSQDCLRIWNPMIRRSDDSAAARILEMLPERWRVIRVYSRDRTVAAKVHKVMSRLLLPQREQQSTSM